MESGNQVFEFGPFRYDSSQKLLFRQGELVSVMPKTLELLAVLLEDHGRLVEKADLMRRVWPDTVVEDVGIARNISQLRKALGDEAEGATYIETVPRKGYRFIAPISHPHPLPPKPAVPPRKPWPWAIAILLLLSFVYWQFYSPSRFLSRPPGTADLAVIPFESLNASQQFTTALSDQLVTQLARVPTVRLVGPSTVRRYQSAWIPTALMARLLALDAVIEGSVQRSGDHTRISARLVDVHTGKVIWASSEEFTGSDLAQIESAAANSLAAQITAQLARP